MANVGGKAKPLKAPKRSERSKRSKRTARAEAAAPSTRYDNRTRAQRAELDEAVLEALPMPGAPGVTRGAVAAALPAPARAVGASLMRLERDGKIARSGRPKASLYNRKEVDR